MGELHRNFVDLRHIDGTFVNEMNQNTKAPRDQEAHDFRVRRAEIALDCLCLCVFGFLGVLVFLFIRSA
jgi:hypothetical protein